MNKENKKKTRDIKRPESWIHGKWYQRECQTTVWFPHKRLPRLQRDISGFPSSQIQILEFFFWWRLEFKRLTQKEKPGMERWKDGYRWLMEKATGVHPALPSVQVMMTQTQSNMGRDVYGGPRNGQMNTWTIWTIWTIWTTCINLPFLIL